MDAPSPLTALLTSGNAAAAGRTVLPVCCEILPAREFVNEDPDPAAPKFGAPAIFRLDGWHWTLIIHAAHASAYPMRSGRHPASRDGNIGCGTVAQDSPDRTDPRFLRRFLRRLVIQPIIGSGCTSSQYAETSFSVPHPRWNTLMVVETDSAACPEFI